MRGPHIPVMLDEVLDSLKPKNGDVILDGTFGAGGYSRAILEKNGSCRVMGIDRDENVEKFAREIKSIYGDRFVFYSLKFSEVKTIVEDDSLDGIVLDLGVSSMQLDDGTRGFSFGKEARLLMTMGRNAVTAYDVVNSFSQEKIASIIYDFGDEAKSRTIAKKIVEYRKLKIIETTTELANLVRSCFNRMGRIDNATKTFQAIRIFVNDELDELKTILGYSVDLLRKNGRLVVVTFNSLEDRIVKRFFSENGNLGTRKVDKYGKNESDGFIFNVPRKKPLIASTVEIQRNIRARSAKLRWGIKC
ncbi:MAG: 16S rRNA (cytosine(1402)-N(4))-methyltransferase RsmH [Rickettsiales bacterium]|nr:16S rRNA (cytosine(1402)-N(4))-methyltransferase RsmH [Rickettsiales bacterium]